MASTVTYPLKLSGLTTREAITDAIYRAVHGIDSNDRALFESAWCTRDEPIFFMQEEYKGIDAINSVIMDRVGHLDTMHYVANIRIDVKDGAKTANATAYAQNQHFGPGKGQIDGATHLLAGGKYDMDFVDEGAENGWRLKKWTFDIVWKEGSFAVFSEE